jgi:cytochrome c oxidase assembly factor CtaG/putative copper export protein
VRVDAEHVRAVRTVFSMRDRLDRAIAVPMTLLIGVGVLAVAVVAAVSLDSGSGSYTVLGNSYPGAVIEVGAPVLRLVSDAAATVCLGSLVFAVCFAGPQRSGVLSAQGYAALRMAGRWATAWFLASLTLVPFDMGDTAGMGLSAVLSPGSFFGMLGALEEPKAWLMTAAAALIVAIGCRIALYWQPTVGLLGLALLGFLPPLCTGHSSSDAGHDLATAAILIHVPVAAVWIGVLTAFLRPSLQGGPQLARRYSRMAWGCWLVLAGSGLVDAVVLVPPGGLLTTGYGLLLMVKIVLVAALGLLGAVLRRRALRGIDQDGGVRRMFQLATGELVLLIGTVAFSVGLTHLPPPAFVNHPVTADQTLLGYNLAGPPTMLRLALDWRFEVLFGSFAIVLAAGYLIGLARLRRSGEHWPVGRTAAWLAGCLVLLLATSSGIGRYAEAMFSVHIASHMLVAMVAPMLLVLGGPVTLTLRALPSDSGAWGPREWLRALSESSAVRVLTHPMVALVVFVGSPFVLYFTGLFDVAVRFHWAHLAIDAYFLIVGYLFAWPVLGVDAVPRPLPNLARLGLLLAAMPFDTVFAAVLMTTHSVIGNGPAGANMYQALALPWVPSLLADQQLAGELALGIGELALLVAALGVLAQWFRREDESDSPEKLLLAHLSQRSSTIEAP